MIITNFAKLSVFIFLLIFSLTGISYGSSALEIMTKVDARYTGAVSYTHLTLPTKA